MITNNTIWWIRNNGTNVFTDNLTKWTSENRLSKGNLYQVAVYEEKKVKSGYNKRSQHKGWTIKRIKLDKLSIEWFDRLEKLINQHCEVVDIPRLLDKLNQFKPCVLTHSKEIPEPVVESSDSVFTHSKEIPLTTESDQPVVKYDKERLYESFEIRAREQKINDKPDFIDGE